MKKGPVGKPDLYFSISERMGSELDLHTRRDGCHEVVAEIVACLVAAGEASAAGSAIDGGAARGQEAESTGNLELDVLVGRIDNLGAERPRICLGADDRGRTAIPGQADGSAPLFVELVTNAAGDRPAVAIEQVKRVQRVCATWDAGDVPTAQKGMT